MLILIALFAVSFLLLLSLISHAPEGVEIKDEGFHYADEEYFKHCVGNRKFDSEVEVTH